MLPLSVHHFSRDLLGHLDAGTHLVQAGMLPLGALLAGFLAEAVGARSTLWIAEIGGLLSAAWLCFSPVRRVRDLRTDLASTANV